MPLGDRCSCNKSIQEDNATRELAQQLGFVPVVPPSLQRRQPWALDKLRYRRRNEPERLFRRLKAWRRMFTRYDENDVMFAAFITVAFIAEALRCVVLTRPRALISLGLSVFAGTCRPCLWSPTGIEVRT